MAVKKHNPVTPGSRHHIGSSFAELTKSTPEKSLLAPLKKSGGRNHRGKMTVPHRGGGHKRRYRIIDFKRDKEGVNATVMSIEYDPNRSAYIALLQYEDGEKRYIIAPEGIKVDQQIVSGPKVSPDVGNCLKLKNIPLGTVIHNIEMRPGKGGVIARSAGSYAQIIAKEGKYASLKMPSGETRRILLECVATVGTVSNSEHNLKNLGKAGRKRWMGKRPRTRPVVMNPVDHPMGGGEGKSSGGHPRSKNGIPAKGYKTRKPKKASNKLIIKRRN